MRGMVSYKLPLPLYPSFVIKREREERREKQLSIIKPERQNSREETFESREWSREAIRRV